MWAAIALSYCVVCWFSAFLLVRFVRRQLFAGVKNGMPLLLLELTAIALAPIFLPYLLCVRLPGCFFHAMREVRTLKNVGRTYRPYEFLPIDSQSAEDWIHQQFEMNTPPFMQLGFTYLGDYRLKPEPLEVYDRVLLSSDGEVLAGVCALQGHGAISLISVLEDGTCIHTSSVENPQPQRTLEPADRLMISYVPDASIEDLYLYHRNVLHAGAASHEAGVLRFREDQFRELLTYDQQIFCRWRYRHGGLDEQPPAPDFDSLRTSQVVSVS